MKRLENKIAMITGAVRGLSTFATGLRSAHGCNRSGVDQCS